MKKSSMNGHGGTRNRFGQAGVEPRRAMTTSESNRSVDDAVLLLDDLGAVVVDRCPQVECMACHPALGAAA